MTATETGKHLGSSDPRQVGYRSLSVCFVVTSPPMLNLLTSDGPDAMGGAELQASLLAQGLRERGWQTCFLVGDYGQGRLVNAPDGTRLIRAYSARSGMAKLNVPGMLRELWEALDTAGADVYLSRGLTWLAGALAVYARQRGKRSIFWFGKNDDARYAVPWRSSLPLHERLPAWYGMRHADAVVVQTLDQKRLLAEHTGREGHVVPNISPWECEEPRGTDGDYALWIGSMQPKKRPHMLLDVAEALPDVRFAMAGGEVPAYHDLWTSVRRRAGELDNVELAGFVPFEQTRELFENAQVLVSTSDGRQEGFPNVFLQAWSVGLPVVATCDPDGLISGHGLGSYCASASEVRSGLRRLTSDPGLRAEIGARALVYVAKHHSLEHVCERLDGLLRGMLDVDAAADAREA